MIHFVAGDKLITGGKEFRQHDKIRINILKNMKDLLDIPLFIPE
jgi:hypothetical protein